MNRQCPSCRGEIPADARFCGHCGQPIPVVQTPASVFCTACGKAMGADAAYCSGCGARIRGIAAPPAHQTPPARKSPPPPRAVAAHRSHQQPTRGSSAFSCGLLAAGFLVLAIGGVVWYSLSSGSSSTRQDRPTVREATSGEEEERAEDSTAPGEQSLLGGSRRGNASAVGPAAVPFRQIFSKPVTGDAIQVDQTLTVTIPPELLPAPTPLTVSVPAKPQPKKLRNFETIGDYEIDLGSMKVFNQNLTLSMCYDAAKLDPDLPASAQIVAASWDPARQQWRRVPFKLDEKTGTLNVRTKHLSRWAAWYTIVRGFKVLEVCWENEKGGYWLAGAMTNSWSGDGLKFRIFYNPDKDPPMAWGQSVGGRKGIAPPSALVMGCLMNDLEKYKAAGFLVPSGTFDVFIDPKLSGAAELDSSFYGIDNIMYLPDPGSWECVEEPRQLIAHEFFHAVQNCYLNVGGMGLRRWWVEATADYASAKVAYENAPAVWAFTTRFVKPWYPGQLPTYFRDVDVGAQATAKAYDDAATLIDPFQRHQYQTSVFVDYLVTSSLTDRKDPGGKRFAALWKASAKGWILTAQSTALEESIDEYLRSTERSSLADKWFRFAMEWYFEGGAHITPLVPPNTQPEALKRNLVTLNEDGSADIQVNINGRYGCEYFKVTPSRDEKKRLMVSANRIPEGCLVLTWPTSDGLDRWLHPETSRNAQSRPLTLPPREFLLQDVLDSKSPFYILVLNRGEPAQFQLNLRPEPPAPVTGYSLYFHVDADGASGPRNVFNGDWREPGFRATKGGIRIPKEGSVPISINEVQLISPASDAMRGYNSRRVNVTGEVEIDALKGTITITGHWTSERHGEMLEGVTLKQNDSGDFTITGTLKVIKTLQEKKEALQSNANLCLTATQEGKWESAFSGVPDNKEGRKWDVTGKGTLEKHPYISLKVLP